MGRSPFHFFNVQAFAFSCVPLTSTRCLHHSPWPYGILHSCSTKLCPQSPDHLFGSLVCPGTFCDNKHTSGTRTSNIADVSVCLHLALHTRPQSVPYRTVCTCAVSVSDSVYQDSTKEGSSRYGNIVKCRKRHLGKRCSLLIFAYCNLHIAVAVSSCSARRQAAGKFYHIVYIS